MLRIKGLMVPEYLVRLVETGQWRGWVSPETLARVAPGMDARIELCESFDLMLKESQGPVHEHEQLRVYRGSQKPAPLPLPWLDQEQSLFIAVGDYGDDTGFALDYRASPERPRVVGGFWEGEFPDHARLWRIVAESFDEFAEVLGF